MLYSRIKITFFFQAMSSIQASGIPVSVTDAKITEFFTFCGKIEGVKTLSSDEKTKSISVEFANPHAVSTALLLNGAELAGAHITVTGTAPEGETTSKSALAEDHEGDISQEDKPKSTIFAEYLAAGYKMSDQLVNKAIEFDKEKGISTRFNDFLSNLDKKYNIHQNTESLQKGADTNMKKLHDQANTNLNWDKKMEEGKRTWESYVDMFKKDKYGSQIHDFYKKTASDVKDVHEEALRLAGLNKDSKDPKATVIDTEKASAPPPPYISSIAPGSTTAQAAGMQAFETEKK